MLIKQERGALKRHTDRCRKRECWGHPGWCTDVHGHHWFVKCFNLWQLRKRRTFGELSVKRRYLGWSLKISSEMKEHKSRKRPLHKGPALCQDTRLERVRVESSVTWEKQIGEPDCYHLTGHAKEFSVSSATGWEPWRLMSRNVTISDESLRKITGSCWRFSGRGDRVSHDHRNC